MEVPLPWGVVPTEVESAMMLGGLVLGIVSVSLLASITAASASAELGTAATHVGRTAIVPWHAGVFDDDATRLSAARRSLQEAT